MFDANGSGFVSFGTKVVHFVGGFSYIFIPTMYFFPFIDAFRRVMEKSIVHENIPFNFDSEFIDMRFGKDRKRQIRYSEFTQLLRVRCSFSQSQKHIIALRIENTIDAMLWAQELHEEHARQAFVHMDRDHDGLIGAREFQQILALLQGHLLTPFVRAHLLDVRCFLLTALCSAFSVQCSVLMSSLAHAWAVTRPHQVTAPNLHSLHRTAIVWTLASLARRTKSSNKYLNKLITQSRVSWLTTQYKLVLG